jgi:hypothetical protein
MSFFSSLEVYVVRLRPLRALMASPQNCKQQKQNPDVDTETSVAEGASSC